MIKKKYYSPEVGVTPLFLSACIMSNIETGNNTTPVNPPSPGPPSGGGGGAPKRVFF